MAVYKVPQDVEAEDKLIGPLTFKKTLFAGVGLAALGVAYLLAKIPPGFIFGLIPMPVAIIFLILAFYPNKDQPVEVIVAAKIRFKLKPRVRIWDQSGVKQLVTITVPRKIEQTLSHGYSEHELTSRLQALAKTLDSRGWAVKNVAVNSFQQPAYAGAQPDQRLISTVALPQAPPIAPDVRPSDDIMDHVANPVAQHFDQMVQKAADAQRQTAIARMQQATPTSSPSTTPLPIIHAPVNHRPGMTPNAAPATDLSNVTDDTGPYATYGASTLNQRSDSNPIDTAPITDEENSLLERIHANKKNQPETERSNLRRVQTPEEIERAEQQEAARRAVEEAAQHTESSVPTPQPGILELAGNNDLNIATLGRQAEKIDDLQANGEVVVSLH